MACRASFDEKSPLSCRVGKRRQISASAGRHFDTYCSLREVLHGRARSSRDFFGARFRVKTRWPDGCCELAPDCVENQNHIDGTVNARHSHDACPPTAHPAEGEVCPAVNKNSPRRAPCKIANIKFMRSNDGVKPSRSDSSTDNNPRVPQAVRPFTTGDASMDRFAIEKEQH